MATRTYVIDGKQFEVEIVSGADPGSTEAEAIVNGRTYRVQWPEHERPTPIKVVPPQPPPVRHTAQPKAAAGDVRAPMAGRVIKLVAGPGDQVEAGAALLVLDAMKMENTIHAPHAGRVAEIAVAENATVLQGALLVRLA